MDIAHRPRGVELSRDSTPKNKASPDIPRGLDALLTLNLKTLNAMASLVLRHQSTVRILRTGRRGAPFFPRTSPTVN
jgi:hypothetical protein